MQRRERDLVRGREEVGFWKGVMLQRGARGAARLGTEVSVHVPELPPTAAGVRGGLEHEVKAETVGGEALETYARDNLPASHSPVLIKS